jgi:hypothetical protein
MAGAGGFEPPYGGIKIRCLTTWLRPIADYPPAFQKPVFSLASIAVARGFNDLPREQAMQ